VSYLDRLRARESGGDDTAKAPTSSARGRYQFLEGTWRGLMRSHPELGLTEDGRNDPEQQERAIQAFTAENASALRASGLDVTDPNLYALHMLGAGVGPQFLKAVKSSPETAISEVIPDSFIDANRNVFLDKNGRPKTVAQVYANYAGSFVSPLNEVDPQKSQATTNPFPESPPVYAGLSATPSSLGLGAPAVDQEGLASALAQLIALRRARRSNLYA
jgi:hypothetical protein